MPVPAGAAVAGASRAALGALVSQAGRALANTFRAVVNSRFGKQLASAKSIVRAITDSKVSELEEQAIDEAVSQTEDFILDEWVPVFEDNARNPNPVIDYFVSRAGDVIIENTNNQVSIAGYYNIQARAEFSASQFFQIVYQETLADLLRQFEEEQNN